MLFFIFYFNLNVLAFFYDFGLLYFFILYLDPTAYGDYGPFMPGFSLVPYSDLAALEEEIKVK